jgi:UDP-N-acetylglucosamine:LPS N-acetylglucosamine transferase
MSEVSHADLHRDIGSLKADVANVKDDIREVRDDVKRLIAAEERRKGERGVIALIATVGGSVGTLAVSKLFPKLFS